MNTLFRFSALLFLLAMTASLFSQNKEATATISGKILFGQDTSISIRPYSVIIQKTWPITFKQFEQQKIDAADYSFNLSMDVDQLTHGSLSVSIFKDIDSSSIERHRFWMLSEIPEGFFSTLYTARFIYNRVDFVIEPGDSLHMLINFDRVDKHGRVWVDFSGRGGANNNLKRSSDYFKNSSKNFRVPLEVGLSNEDLLMKNELKNLKEAKDSISQSYFHLLETDALFSNYTMKHTLIRAHLYDQDLSVEEKRELARGYYAFMDTLNLGSAYIFSSNFRSYLGFYLEYVNRIVTGRDVPFNRGEKNNFLAKAIFEKDVLKVFLYERLSFQLEVLYYYPDVISLYKEFIDQFPGTPESYRLEQIYNKHYPVTVGQQAPELELIDSLGHTTYLSELRGKVLIISTFPKMGDSECVRISLNPGYLPREKWDWTSFDYYVKDGRLNSNLPAYQFLSSHRYSFILGKSGRIRAYGFNADAEDKEISVLKSENYTVLTRWKNYAQKHPRGIIAFLSILLFISLVFIFMTRLRQKRQILIKRQLTSELKAIRSQLNPHFLFNSLNSIQSFINKCDTKTANMHLSKFSLLMRKVIELSEKESISLKEELDFNKTFIELEQLRYGFKCTFDIDDTIDLYNVEIPGMIIQPFIENAIVHGMADLGEKGELGISVKETGNNEIFVEITDNGKGFLTHTEKGLGLRSSWERIDLVNSQSRDKIQLHIESSSKADTKTGTTVKLIIPKKY
jgi:Histidine kinase